MSLLQIERNIIILHRKIVPKLKTAKYSLKFSYTISNKRHVGIRIVKNQLLSKRDCFNVETELLLNERICSPLGAIFFPLKVTPMRIDNFIRDFKSRNCQSILHQYVSLLKSQNFNAANIKWFTVS